LALRKLAEDDPIRNNLKEVKAAAARAARLTKQLLVFSRKHQPEARSIDLNSIVKDTDKMLRRLIGEDIELVTSLDSELRAIMADPSHLEQVLVNLAVNARDAMTDGGRLRITTANVDIIDEYAQQNSYARSGAHVMLSIGDTGCGMDAATRERIFEPFFTTKDREHGTGLGLSTVYGIIREAGGHIAVDSEVGLGTTFRLYIPAIEGGAAPVAIQPESTEFTKGSGSVLVVEDDAGLRCLLVGVLSECG
jgi:signal transduction histidine kinase